MNDMKKLIISIDKDKVNESMLKLLSELEYKGYAKDGYLVYEESEKDVISAIFRKYGYSFCE